MEKISSKTAENPLLVALSYLTSDVRDKIALRLSSMKNGGADISEIRLRAGGVSALTVGGVNLPLDFSVDKAVMREIFKRISGGAAFAHRDDVCRGFITLPMGVRVGVSGRARYEGGSIVGVSDISSLVFRIPSGECSFARSLYLQWLVRGGGILICSRAGNGKTTAIRSLARLIGSGERPRRVVVVDERCEFDAASYVEAHVDVLSGYRRALGVDIAIRTMSAEVVIVDEISSLDDARAMLSALGAGVTVIATVHAECLFDALKRDYVRELVDGGLFECACIIERGDEGLSYKLVDIEEKGVKKLHGMGDI